MEDHAGLQVSQRLTAGGINGVVVAQSYSRRMGRPLTAAGMRKLLTEAWERYREQQQAGDDMFKAGEDLFDVVGGIVRPVPCAPPRIEMLKADKDKESENPLIDLATRQAAPSDDYGYTDYRDGPE